MKFKHLNGINIKNINTQAQQTVGLDCVFSMAVSMQWWFKVCEDVLSIKYITQ